MAEVISRNRNMRAQPPARTYRPHLLLDRFAAEHIYPRPEGERSRCA